MQSVSTWLTGGARPVAAPLAGAIGTFQGVRSALIAGTVLLLVPVIVLVLSPVRSLRALPAAPPDPGSRASSVTDSASAADASTTAPHEGDRP